MSEQTNFDSKAKDWDQSEKRRRTISIIANKIKENTKLDTNMHVMDFGAGTGLLTLELSPFVQQIIAVDTSQKMLGILKDKIETLKNNNISVLQLDIEHEKLSEVKVHLIVSSMTVHHLKNPGKVIQKLYDILLENGQLIIADLETTTNNSNDISDV
ncbi:MAG: class I SAM-dependent methyltransferase, partial [Desulfobacteraceae bacterium]|nr:class I SAM-dependent methyltransferase [Desulfobacteraceae bacterium]